MCREQDQMRYLSFLLFSPLMSSSLKEFSESKIPSFSGGITFFGGELKPIAGDCEHSSRTVYKFKDLKIITGKDKTIFGHDQMDRQYMYL